MQSKMLLILSAILLSACSRDYIPQWPVFEKNFWLESAKKPSYEATQNIKWWESFNDPVLNQLIEKAHNNSPDIKIALARIEAARANEDEIIASQMPLFSGGAEVSRNKFSRNVTNRPNARGYGTTISAGFDALWEVNYFGLDPALKSAASYAAIAESNYNNVLVTLAGDVARNYFEIRKLQITSKVISDNITAQTEIFNLNESLEEAGKVSRAEIIQSKTLLENTKASLIPIQTQIVANTYTLEVLLGVKSGELKTLLAQPKFINALERDYALASPISVLAARPDVRAAEEEIKYRAAISDVEFAEYYPKLSLSAFLGLESAKVSNLFQGRSIAGNLAAGITAPIFDFGRIKARVAAADAQTKEAIANYEKAVLTGLAEVEIAINSIENGKKYIGALHEAYKSAKLSTDLATDRYRAGLSPYLNVLEAQKNVNDLSQMLAESNFDLLINHVSLYKSLGGMAESRKQQLVPVPPPKLLKTVPDLEIKLQENIDDKL